MNKNSIQTLKKLKNKQKQQNSKTSANENKTEHI